MQVHNYSDPTVANRRTLLGYFIAWAEQRGLIADPPRSPSPSWNATNASCSIYRKANGDPLSFQHPVRLLVPMRTWFKWLARQNHILYNPASELELPKLEQRLPKHILTAQEAEHRHQPGLT